MTNDLFQRAKDIVESNEYITIATASRDGQPWNTPVYAVHDEQYNFFWSSWIQARIDVPLKKLTGQASIST